jgi:hypothetical protein
MQSNDNLEVESLELREKFAVKLRRENKEKILKAKRLALFGD